MKEYHKIQTVYKRDPKTNLKTLLEGEFSLPEFEYLKYNDWTFTEKVDGTNIRIMYKEGLITFGGKTDRAQIPSPLINKLNETFLPMKDRFIEMFNDAEVCFYGEGYGCFSSNTGVLLSDGTSKTISEIVNKKLPVKVLTYNFQDKKIEASGISDYFKYPNQKLIRIELEKTRKGGRGRFNQIVCTENHLVYTNNGYKKAAEIKPDDSIMSWQKDLSPIQKQALYGVLLGDGSIDSKYRISISHSSKQKDYINFLKQLFGNIHVCESFFKSGYGSDMIRIIISNKELFGQVANDCLSKNKKTITKEWMQAVTPISLAFWYMDGGSIDSKHRKNQVARLATQGYSRKELKLLQEMLLNKYSISGQLKQIKPNQWYIQLNVESSQIFFLLIAPYVISSLKYKLPLYIQKIPCVFEYIDNSFLHGSRALKPAKVKRITSVINKRIMKDYVYDIQTKNKNYFVGSGFLVHNSRIQKGGGNYRQDQSFVLFDIKIGEWWLKRKDVENIASQICIGIVPIIGTGTLFEMVEKTRNGFNSQWGNFLAEGIVARPSTELFARNGRRIITKIKHKDFRMLT